MANGITLTEYDLKRERLWGAPAIADFLDVSVHCVYDLALDPDCPIFKPGNRYCAIKTELWRWSRTKPSALASTS